RRAAISTSCSTRRCCRRSSRPSRHRPPAAMTRTSRRRAVVPTAAAAVAVAKRHPLRASTAAAAAVLIRPPWAASSAASSAASCADPRSQRTTKSPGRSPGLFISEVLDFAVVRERLFPGRLAQRVVDAVLPARPAPLEIFQHILVETQRDLLLHARHRVLLRRRFSDLGGGALEGGFRLGAGVVERARPARLISHGQIPSNRAVER